MNDKITRDAKAVAFRWPAKPTARLPKEQAEPREKRAYFVIKRVFDIFASLIGLIVLSPVFLVIAIVIRLDSKGKAIFTHKRIGKGGALFKLYKFRSMVTDAEEMIKRFTPEQKKEFEENYKLDRDPRITKIGGLLRRTSLDELPQLVNILRGDISLVGPRPLLLEEDYGDKMSEVLSITPGLTGYWQVSGRCDTTYDERIALQIYYVEHASLWLDVKILLRTVVVVLRKVGAK